MRSIQKFSLIIVLSIFVNQCTQPRNTANEFDRMSTSVEIDFCCTLPDQNVRGFRPIRHNCNLYDVRLKVDSLLELENRSRRLDEKYELRQYCFQVIPSIWLESDTVYFINAIRKEVFNDDTLTIHDWDDQFMQIQDGGMTHFEMAIGISDNEVVWKYFPQM